MNRIVRFFLLFFSASFAIVGYTVAQDTVQIDDPVSVQCGDIVESELQSDFQETPFQIDLKAGDALNVSIVPIGKGLKTGILINGPTNLGIAISNGEVAATSFTNFKGKNPESQPKLDTDIVSATGTYTIRIVNFEFLYYYYKDGNYVNLNGSGGIGAYTLNIGCVLKDGTIIQPGDMLPAPSPPTESSGNISQLPVSAFSGIGFPGLAPVDFASVAKIPMIANVPMTGGVAPDGSTILGYTFDASANVNLVLSFTRLSGNLNLGLVVLSSDNKVVFQASLVTSSELTTKFTLPTAGTYTIGIFRIDLLPPAAPEATAFQLTATLNP